MAAINFLFNMGTKRQMDAQAALEPKRVLLSRRPAVVPSTGQHGDGEDKGNCPLWG
jgi:hypothetical protein